jgi:large subunit ribosomal protein L21
MAKKNETNADFTVIKTGGKQYLVTAGEEILVDRLKNKKNKVSAKGDTIQFETLLKESKGSLKIGSPNLKTGMAKGEVIEEIKDEKIVVFKYKPKKRYRKKTGFRAKKTKIKILGF